MALHLLEVVWDAVGDDDLVDVGLLDQPGVRQQAVRRQRVDLVRAALLQPKGISLIRITNNCRCDKNYKKPFLSNYRGRLKAYHRLREIINGYN